MVRGSGRELGIANLKHNLIAGAAGRVDIPVRQTPVVNHLSQ